MEHEQYIAKRNMRTIFEMRVSTLSFDLNYSSAFQK